MGEVRQFPDPISLSSAATSPISPNGVDAVVRSDDLSNRNQAHSGHWAFQVMKLGTFNFFVLRPTIPSLSLPGVSVGTPFSDFKVPGDKPVFGALEMTVMLDERWEAWLEIQRWMRGNGFPNSWQEHRAITEAKGWNFSQNPERSDISLSSMTNASSTSSGIEGIRFVFNDAMPTYCGPVRLDTDDEGLVFDVTFEYNTYDAFLAPQGFPE